MRIIPKKYAITIPKNITFIYSKKKKIIIIKKFSQKKFLRLKLKLLLLKSKNIIKVSSTTLTNTSNNNKKKTKIIQGTTISLLKQLITETSAKIYIKLKLIGIGYKVFNVENFQNQLLLFKLGYSHFIYFQISKQLKFFCLKLTNLFLWGKSYQTVKATAALIQSYKKPEPYKGKGILYNNEKIQLKEGKKI
jgi:large subunit ribosomal protein L6